MKIKWHGIQLQCPKCDQKATILGISSAADGSILVELVCVRCNTFLTWETTGSLLVAKAYKADLEESKGVKTPKLLVAPTWTTDDRNWLKQIGSGGI